MIFKKTLLIIAIVFMFFLLSGGTCLLVDKPIQIVNPQRSVPLSPLSSTTTFYTDSGQPYHIPMIQNNTSLSPKVTTNCLVIPFLHRVEFNLISGDSFNRRLTKFTPPYQVEFYNLPLKEYELKVDLVNLFSILKKDPDDLAINIGIGNIAVAIGDSVTVGSFTEKENTPIITSWLNAPDSSLSNDRRNFPQFNVLSLTFNKSFLVSLNNKLAGFFNSPVFLLNEGQGGATTAEYLILMEKDLFKKRQKTLVPNIWLINLGANDALKKIPPENFKENLLKIIVTLQSEYGAKPELIYLAKPSYNINDFSLENYLSVINEIVEEKKIKNGPDFYNFFKNHYLAGEKLYEDNIHPNDTGQNELSRLWTISIIKPKILDLSFRDNHLFLSWDNPGSEQSIVGYKVYIGKKSRQYSREIDVKNKNGTLIEDLEPGQTYFISVIGYDNDPFKINLTDLSEEIKFTVK